MRGQQRSRVLQRQRAQRRGKRAEWLCVWHLRLRGWRCPAGELDIVAKRGGILAIIEVKSRDELAVAAAALPPRQRRRVTRATEAFLNAHPQFASATLRFDLMLVVRHRLPQHQRDAWRADS